jgi:hypothetical protein
VDGPREPDVLGEELVDDARPGQDFAQGERARGDLSNVEELEAVLVEVVGEELRLEIGDLRLGDRGGWAVEGGRWRVGEPRLEN